MIHLHTEQTLQSRKLYDGCSLLHTARIKVLYKLLKNREPNLQFFAYQLLMFSGTNPSLKIVSKTTQETLLFLSLKRRLMLTRLAYITH